MKPNANPLQFLALIWFALADFSSIHRSLLLAENTPNEALQIRRVIVPAEDLPLLSGDFVPIQVEELQQLIGKYREQTKPPFDVTTPRLTQAVYVASLVGLDLVSEASRYSIEYHSDSPKYFRFNPCSLALRSTNLNPSRLAEGARKGFVPSSESLRFDLNGIPTIIVREPTDFWFAWSLRGQAEHDLSRLKFSFDFPRCLDSRLLLQLPPMWRVSSEHTVARQVKDPTLAIDDSWPNAVSVDRDASNWWSIELSGSSQANFELIHSAEAFQLNYDHLILRERVEYRLQPSKLEVTSEFQFPDAVEPSSSLVIRVNPGLHVSSVSLDEQEMKWRPSRLPHSIEILGASDRKTPTSTTPSQLILRGLATWPLLDENTKLPAFHIDRGFTVDGSGSLSIHPDWMANLVQIENGQVVSRSGTAQLGGLGRWDYEWTGETPSIELQATPRKLLGVAETLTRLANENETIVATSWITINANANPRAAIRFLVAPGWTIESAQPSDRRYLTTVQKVPTSETSEQEIELSPPLVNQALTLEIRSRYLSPSNSESMNATAITFDGGRPFSLRDMKQTDFYWIEPTGRYKIEANVGLVQCRVEAKELSENHRQRLPRIGDVWLIRPETGQVPGLTFRKQDSPYSVKLESSITPGVSFISATYRLRCTPIAGAVSSVSVDFNRLGDTPIRWRQRNLSNNGSEEWTAIHSRTLQRSELGVATETSPQTPAARIERVNLKNATTDAFELEGYVEFPWSKSEATERASLNIPLPSIPEAVQQDATLQLDNRLGLMLWDDDAPWTPAGYVSTGNSSEARQFNYDPTRVFAVDVRTSNLLMRQDAWLSEVVTRYQLYSDGQRKLQFDGRFHANDASEFLIDLPLEWRLRSATLSGKSVTISVDLLKPERVRIWIPRRQSVLADVELSIVADGPRTAVAHRDRLELPSLRPCCPVVSHRYEFWSPPTLSATSMDFPLQFNIPRFDVRNWWPASWYRSLQLERSNPNPSELENSKQRLGQFSSRSDREASQLRLAWQTEFVAEIGSGRRPILLLVEEARRAEEWIVVFIGFALALCVGAIRKSMLLSGLILLLFAMFAAHGRSLEMIQLVALGWLVGAVLQTVSVFCRSKSNAIDRSAMLSKVSTPSRLANEKGFSNRNEGSASKTKPHFSTIWIGFALMFSALTSNGYLFAQSSPEKIYHVVLPLDSNDEFTSPVAYASEDLLRKLRDERTTEFLENRFISVRHELNLAAQDLRNTPSIALFKMKYEIDVRDLSKPIQWPLDATQASFVSMRVDGSETPLGSRLRWDDHVLQWTPPKKGIAHIELTVDPILGRNSEGHSTMIVRIVPIAGAQLDVDAGEVTDVQINAMGQISNPALGRFQVALGPQSTLSVSWPKTEKETRASMPSATVENEFALLDEAVFARTKIDFDYGSSNPSLCDIECDAAWQPVGRIWGNATLLDAVPSSSNSRRRYRLRWERSSLDSESDRSVVIHWTPSSLRSSAMNLPNIELPGVRINESLLRCTQNKNSVWNIEGLQNWPVIDLASRFDWLPRSGAEIVSYRKPPNGNSAFLRRTETGKKLQATIESRLRFRANQVFCETSVSFKPLSYRNPDLKFTLPSDVEVQSVKINQIDVPFSVSEMAQDKIRIQALLDPTGATLESMVVKVTQKYRESSWMALPFLSLEDCSVTEHLASATRIVNQRIAWDGLDFTTPTPNSDKRKTEWDVPSEINKELEVTAWRLSVEPSIGEPPSTQLLSPEETQILPRFRIERSSETHQGRVVSRLDRTEERWKFHVHGRVEAAAVPIDGVLLEVPELILDGLSCSHRIARFTSPEIGRQLVFIFSDQLEFNRPFEFELHSNLPPIESSATTALPEVRLMGDVEWQQWLIVPQFIASQEARWNLSGARTVDATSLPDFIKPDLRDAVESSLVVVPTIDRPRIRLSNVAANRLPIALDLAMHALTIDTDRSKTICSTFRFIPRGHKSVQIRKPANLELLAIECNGRNVPESSILTKFIASQSGPESDSTLEIRLLSSSMPQQIRLYLSQPPESENCDFRKQLPYIPNAQAKNTLLVINSKELENRLELQAITEKQAKEIIFDNAIDLLEQSASFIAEAPLNERNQWWKDWDASSSADWLDAIDFSNPIQTRNFSDRLHAILDRLDLPFQLDQATREQPPANASALFQAKTGDSIEAQSSEHSMQFFLIESVEESTSIENSQQANKAGNAKSAKRIASKTGGGWVIWLLITCAALRVSHRTFEKWKVPLKQFLQNRPWWLFVGLGLLLFFFAPSFWFGPAFLVIGVYFAARACLYEFNRTRFFP